MSVFPLVESTLVKQRPGRRLPLSPADIGEVNGLVAGRIGRDGASAGRRRAAAARPVISRRRTRQASGLSAHHDVATSSDGVQHDHSLHTYNHSAHVAISILLTLNKPEPQPSLATVRRRVTFKSAVGPNRVKVCQRRRSNISMRTLCSSGGCPWSTTSTVCVNSLHFTASSSDLGNSGMGIGKL